MGTTRFSGPVYGAKHLLVSFSKENIPASQANLEVFQIDVPAGEDWFLTTINAYCDVQGNGGEVKVRDDGVDMLAADLALVSDDSVEANFATDQGEDEGKKVAGGSVLTVLADNGATTAIEDLSVSIFGYIRKQDTP